MKLQEIYNILASYSFIESSIKAIYLRGSRALGTAGYRFDGTESDWDFVVITTDYVNSRGVEHIVQNNVDLTIYNSKLFKNIIRNNEIWALECIYSLSKNVFYEEGNDEIFTKYFELDLKKLKRSVLYEAEHKILKSQLSFRKKDVYMCLKSLFIALRFVFYGCEIAKFSRIENFCGVNYIWDLMVKNRENLKEYTQIKRFFYPYYYDILYRFLKICPFCIFPSLYSITEGNIIEFDESRLDFHSSDFSYKKSTFLIKKSIYLKEILIKIIWNMNKIFKKTFIRKEIKQEILNLFIDDLISKNI